MSHASSFGISQALVTLLLLPFSPTILTATDNPVPLPHLSQPSDDRNQEHGVFFAWPDMVRRDSCAAPSSVTSPVPAAYLNSCWHDYRFSGQAGSADIMSYTSRFCISQALVTLLLLPFSQTILTATDNPVPLPLLSHPSDDCNQEHGFFFAWPDMVRRDSCAAPSSVTSPVPAAYLNSCWHDQGSESSYTLHGTRYSLAMPDERLVFGGGTKTWRRIADMHWGDAILMRTEDPSGEGGDLARN
ncbi:hypothetical protein MRX96_028874 [Rhipicephalus microplus]